MESFQLSLTSSLSFVTITINNNPQFGFHSLSPIHFFVLGHHHLILPSPHSHPDHLFFFGNDYNQSMRISSPPPLCPTLPDLWPVGLDDSSPYQPRPVQPCTSIGSSSPPPPPIPSSVMIHQHQKVVLILLILILTLTSQCSS